MSTTVMSDLLALGTSTGLDRLLGDVSVLRRMGVEVDRLLTARGAAHLVPGPDADPAAGRPWRIDPVPLVLDGSTFDGLAASVVERMRAMEALVADLYGERVTVQDGHVPAEALAAAGSYRLAQVGGPSPRRWLVTYAADVIALRDGTWRVVQDRTDAPSGIGFALLDRSVMVRVAADLLGGSAFAHVASITGFGSELRRAVAAATSADGPRVVVFTEGPDHPAYVEQSYLARQLGFHLVEAADLVVRRQKVWLRTIGGLEPIDVLLRCVDDPHTDPVEWFGPGRGGVPGLLGAVAERGVALANAHGTGVLEDPDLAGFWRPAIESLTGVTLRLGDYDAEAARIGPMPTPALVDGELTEAPVVVRLHAVAGPSGVRVMAGGNGRVLGPHDAPTAPSTATAKDIWVLGAHRSSPVIVGQRVAQVDLVNSVPTRAAAAFFEVGRETERAGALSRAVAVISARREQDPTLDDDTDGEWEPTMVAILSHIAGPPSAVPPARFGAGAGSDGAGSDEAGRDDAGSGDGEASAPPPPGAALDAALRVATTRLAEAVRSVVTEATSVSEYLPQSTSRVLRRLVDLHRQLSERDLGLDLADDLTADLAAFDGLWTESTVRGDAWRFGDLGKRLARAASVAALIEWAQPMTGGSVAQAVKAEVMLAVDESLNAYRRRYRTDLDAQLAVEFVATHPNNPRSLTSALRRAVHHCGKLDWPAGAAAVEHAASLTDVVATDPGALGDLQARLAAAIKLVHTTWFATPVNPVAMKPVPQWGRP